MKHIFSAALSGILVVTLLSGCGGNGPDHQSEEVCIKQTSSDGSYITYDYNTDGSQTKATNYSATGTLLGWTEYTYNENGLKTEEITYDPEGAVQTHSTMEYDNGNMISRTCYDAEDIQQYQETFTYDEDGFLTKETYADDTTSYWYDVENDKNGNETKRTMMDDSDNPEMVIVSDYNSDNLLIKTTTYEDAAMEMLQGWSENDYDADGNLIRQTAYNAAAQINAIWEYNYNTNGSLIGTTISGTGSAEVLNTYDYMPLSELLNANET